jgi:hypothetical protein
LAVYLALFDLPYLGLRDPGVLLRPVAHDHEPANSEQDAHGAKDDEGDAPIVVGGG